MNRRKSLVLLLFLCSVFAVTAFHSSPSGSILGDIQVPAPPVTVSASIPSVDTVPPVITYISPLDHQQNVPADADIQLNISDSFSGVDINSVQIVINGDVYNNLLTNPWVTVTGAPPLYNIVVHPFNPLYTSQTDTVTTSASDLAGNHQDSTITFNQPTPSPTPTSGPGPTSTPIPTSTPMPTSTPIPTSTPAPTSTPGPSPTPGGPTPTPGPSSTPTPGPTSTPNPISTPTPTLHPTGPYTFTPTPTINIHISATPTPVCPNQIFCPVCPTATPSAAPTPAGPDLFPPEIEFIKPGNHDFISLTPAATIKISDSGSGVNLNSVRISLDQTTLIASDPEFSVTGNSAAYTITVKFNQPLSPNTSYYLIVYASDLAGNRLTKSINLKTNNPLINRIIANSSSVRIPGFLLALLLLLLIVGLIFYLIGLLHHLRDRDSRPLGLVFNSLTLEPLSGVRVQILNVDNRPVTVATTNIFGILSANLPRGKYHLLVKNRDFAFPSIAHLKRADYPTPYLGQPFSISDSTNTFLHLPLDPHLKKSFSYRLHQHFLPRPGIITDAAGNPQTGVQIGLKETKFNSLITTRVSDSLGHYRFLVPHGHYQVVIVGTDTVLQTIDTRHLVGGYTIIDQNLHYPIVKKDSIIKL